MFEKFDDGARRAIVQSLSEARSLRQPIVETSHMLLSLAADSNGEPSRLLSAEGATYGAIRSTVQRVGYTQASPAKSLCSQEFQAIVDECRMEADLSGGPIVTPTRLLIGLLTQKSGAARGTIRAMAIEPDWLLMQLRLLPRLT